MGVKENLFNYKLNNKTSKKIFLKTPAYLKSNILKEKTYETWQVFFRRNSVYGLKKFDWSTLKNLLHKGKKFERKMNHTYELKFDTIIEQEKETLLRKTQLLALKASLSYPIYHQRTESNNAQNSSSRRKSYYILVNSIVIRSVWMHFCRIEIIYSFITILAKGINNGCFYLITWFSKMYSKIFGHFLP